ncbi:MAG: tRNA pseudouridine(55) synthase TruB [Salinivirgaceae bacterium]|nr:tRNA pseudouridine(55) synthase TruB [Salinivirgaceae bacterium]
MNFIEGEVILIDKPLEWTSFDIVNKVRYIIRDYLKVKKIKVGHAGTLDPLATGLLILCTGKFTKKIEEYQAQAKEYVTTIKLGATTPSFDRETEEDATFPINHIDRVFIDNVLKKFIGEQEQMPPMFSAKKVNGKKAYEAARKGETIELKANKIVINSIEVMEFELPYIKLKVKCSKGTYIRALGRDIGKELNSGGYLFDLRRTKIGNYNVESAINISDFEKMVNNL